MGWKSAEPWGQYDHESRKAQASETGEPRVFTLQFHPPNRWTSVDPRNGDQLFFTAEKGANGEWTLTGATPKPSSADLLGTLWIFGHRNNGNEDPRF